MSKYADQWLAEWKITQTLCGDVEQNEAANSHQDETPVDPKVIQRLQTPFENSDESFCNGTIRLLSPELVPNEIEEKRSPFVYVAILSPWGGEDPRFLVAPFSPYTVPASTGELLLEGQTDTEQKVLEVWNSCIVSRELLMKSWVVGKLSEKNLRDGNDLWDSMILGKKLDADVLSRTGDPINESTDARAEHQQIEVDTLAFITVL